MRDQKKKKGGWGGGVVSKRDNGTWPMGTFDKLSESVRIVWCVCKPHNTKVVPHVTEFLHHGVHGRHPLHAMGTKCTT